MRNIDMIRRLETLAADGDWDAAREIARLERRQGKDATQGALGRAVEAGIPMETLMVHESRLEDFEKKVRRFQKKAVKAGLEEPEAIHTDTMQVPIYKRDPDNPAKAIRVGYHVFHTYALAFHSYQFDDGWTFVGMIDHPRKTQGPDAKNLLHTVCSPEQFKAWNLEQYRCAEPDCVHCKLNRRRKTTVLLEKDGEVRQVGKSCLKEYVGIELAKSMTTLMGGFGWGEDWSRYDEAKPWTPLVDFVAVCYASILALGWTSKGDAYRSASRRATASLAGDQIYRHNNYLHDVSAGRTPHREHEAGYRQVREAVAEHSEFARKAIEWAANPTRDSEFTQNLAAVASMRGIDPKQMGFAAYIAEGFRREEERRREREMRERSQRHAKNEWFGTVGDWIGRDRKRSKKDRAKGLQSHPARVVTIVSKRDLEMSTLIKMVDDQGFRFAWFSTYGAKVQPGDKVEMTATVKKHSEFRGQRETHVNRCEFTSVD